MEDIPYSRIYGNQRDIDTYRQMAVISPLPLHILLSSDGNPGYEIPREIIPKYKEISTDISFIYFILIFIINNTRNPNIKIIRPS